MLMNPEFWVLVAFVIFFALFGGRIWRPLVAMLDDRAAGIQAELAQAARLRQDAEIMLREAQDARQAALGEAREILDRSRAEAIRVAEAMHAEAEAQARRRERSALDRIAAAEKAAMTEIRQIAAEVAVAAASAVIADTLTAEDDAALIDRAIAELPHLLRTS
jgi:F-type H+-transporting ATPase subunit b